MYNPEGSNETHSQWIELYNNGPSQIALDKKLFGIIDEVGLSLSTKDPVHYLNCHTIKDGAFIDPGKFIIIAKSKVNFINDYSGFDGNVIEGNYGLSANNSHLRLSNDRCATFFSDLLYERSWGGSDNGMSLEKIDFENANSRDNWQESYLIGGTPGQLNSLPVKNDSIPHIEESPTETEATNRDVYINELLPNPSKDKEEFIELYNPSEEKIDLAGWTLKDASKKGHYVFPAKTPILPLDFLVVYGTVFKFALNNSGLEKVFLFDPEENLISSVSYTGSKRDLSYNFDGAGWRWSKFLTPGEENGFNNLPQTKNKIPKKAYQNTYVEFSTKAKDKDGDKLKYVWDFGDGHKSYLKKTRHKFEKTGKYAVTLKTFDGSEDKVETFSIEIKKFPKFNIEIVALSPNPKGKDTGAEYITLRSNEKKSVDLKGWSIATGWKNMINHPIAESLIIDPKKELRLTNTDSKFTLQNKFAKVELRYPSGKAASSMKYKKDEGILDDETYVKGANGWQWISSTPTETAQASDPLPETEGSAPDPPAELLQAEKTDIEVAIGSYSPVERNALPIKKIEQELFRSSFALSQNNHNKNVFIVNDVFFFTFPQEGNNGYADFIIDSVVSPINSKINSILSI
jgi:hypothetical protein